jgi:hypothetical protein
MKQGSNSRRSRGRGKGQRPQKIHNFDSNGPEGRVRGNAQQVYEKYLAMARDAMAAGDRIATENYFQHAEHYLRVIMASDNGNGRLEAFKRRQQFGPFGSEEFGDEGMDGEEGGQGSGQPQAQQQRPQQGNGEGRETRDRDRDRDGGNNARKVQIEKSDARQPKQQGDDDDGDDDNDEGLRRTLAV